MRFHRIGVVSRRGGSGSVFQLPTRTHRFPVDWRQVAALFGKFFGVAAFDPEPVLVPGDGVLLRFLDRVPKSLIALPSEVRHFVRDRRVEPLSENLAFSRATREMERSGLMVFMFHVFQLSSG